MRALRIAALAAAATAVLVFGTGTGASADTGACGPASAGLVYGLDDTAVHEIYNLLLGDAQVTADSAHITGSAELARAVADGDVAKVYAATHRIVYTPYWHIVRLRVLSASGRVLADIGGPYILAPVRGAITYQGAVVGSYVMSVQDDRGYKKLVQRIAGIPVELYLHSRPLMGTIAHPPPAPPPAGPLRLGGVSYTVDAFTAAAFPTGTVRIAVFVPPPSAAQSAETCPQLHLDTIAAFVAHIAAGLPLAGFSFQRNTSLFVNEAYPYAQTPIFVLDGSQLEAGTNGLSGAPSDPPPALPRSGPVSYDGSDWLVDSFEPYPPDRIYVLGPATLGP